MLISICKVCGMSKAVDLIFAYTLEGKKGIERVKNNMKFSQIPLFLQTLHNYFTKSYCYTLVEQKIQKFLGADC